MRTVSHVFDQGDLDDFAPPRPSFDELVARVQAIDERVDAMDRMLFGGTDGDVRGSDGHDDPE